MTHMTHQEPWGGDRPNMDTETMFFSHAVPAHPPWPVVWEQCLVDFFCHAITFGQSCLLAAALLGIFISW